jgi:hypothetical protein
MARASLREIFGIRGEFEGLQWTIEERHPQAKLMQKKMLTKKF